LLAKSCVFCVLFEFVDHGGCPGNTAQALARWWHSVALSEALDVLHRAMCPASYRHICMAIEIASNSPTFLVVVDSLLLTTTAKNHSNS
jgi:hypothetical protein